MKRSASEPKIGRQAPARGQSDALDGQQQQEQLQGGHGELSKGLRTRAQRLQRPEKWVEERLQHAVGQPPRVRVRRERCVRRGEQLVQIRKQWASPPHCELVAPPSVRDEEAHERTTAARERQRQPAKEREADHQNAMTVATVKGNAESLRPEPNPDTAPAAAANASTRLRAP